ncbi:hypothetical protein [Helicobacter sp. T3_23-1056]
MRNFNNFSVDKICELFSHRRISSYDNTNRHFENFDLIALISKNIGIAEVLLRNKIDFVMSRIDSSWLDNLPSDIELKTPKEPNPSRDKIISIQSLGFWVCVVDYYKIHNQIFSLDFLDSVDFKRYYERNVNGFKNGSQLRRYQKAGLILHLLRNLRNRAFHFENLYKLNIDNQPRLSATLKKPKFIINLEASKIQMFLNDLIDELSK